MRCAWAPCDDSAGAWHRFLPMLRANHYARHYNEQIGTTEPYRGTDHTVATMVHLAKGAVDPRAMVQSALQGERSIRLRRHAEQIINNIRPKDYSSELIAIGKWWGNAGRYTRDPLHIEMLRTPDRLLDDALAGNLACDCFPEDTLLLRDDFTFVPISSVLPGQRIWGRDRWSTVEGVAFKGSLDLDAIRLNNGNWVRLTPDHKVYVATCQVHDESARARPCSCGMESREVRRIAVSELREGMVLLQPERVAFGSQSMDPDRSYVEGLYLSDGWNQDYSFSISGLDGAPKEAQKREVEAICEKLGVATTWYRKHINVRDSSWAARLALMGEHASQKRALSIDLDEGAAAALLRGIMADSGRNSVVTAQSRTLTTTSRTLMLQARVLLKMFGISARYSYIENHGGLGTHPIWRLSTRQRADGKRTKLLRVKEIVRSVGSSPCFDITTDDHYVYLPEADVTVSNCDEFALAIAVSCMTIGARANFVTVGFKPRLPGQPKVHTHVFCRAQDPRTKIWWVLDPVAGRKTANMLKRVKQYTIFEVD